MNKAVHYSRAQLVHDLYHGFVIVLQGVTFIESAIFRTAWQSVKEFTCCICCICYHINSKMVLSSSDFNVIYQSCQRETVEMMENSYLNSSFLHHTSACPRAVKRQRISLNTLTASFLVLIWHEQRSSRARPSTAWSTEQWGLRSGSLGLAWLKGKS